MGHRLSKITTRTGDRGETGLGDGSRVAKDSARIAALGDVDELNSTLGVLLAEPLPEDVRALLVEVQHDLFDLGSELAVPGYDALAESRIARLEGHVEHYNAGLEPLKEFILPGGTRPAALAHLARTVCRRAERAVVRVAGDATLSPRVQVYLNRLSDLLFILGRVINRAGGAGDVLWHKNRPA
jgi:cob(I)alamin adenosyltransferase